jgi:hypothetical protein
MSENAKYYEIVDEFTTKEEPAGVLRRFTDADRRDESFGRDLAWKFSPLLYSYERGDTQYDLIPISEEEAERIVERIRRSVGGEQ